MAQTGIDIPDLQQRAQDYWRCFSLRYEEDGVYIDVPEEWTRQDVYDDQFVKQFLEHQDLNGIDLPRTLVALKTAQRTVRVAPQQPPAQYGESLLVLLSRDKMECVALLLPASAHDSLHMQPSAAGRVLSVQYNVHAGLREDEIKRHLEEQLYYQPFLAAQGVPPQQGDDARLEFFFDVNKKYTPIASVEDDKVDYRDLNLFENADEGQLLIRKTPATAGIPGLTVTGEVLGARPGKDVPLPSGKNVELSADRLEMFSQINGRIEYANKRVVISNVLKIPNDVDMSVGHIDFNGDVVVSGAIISGMKVKAAGSIEVFGHVEAAMLEAGSSIVLHWGMQAGSVGTIKAGGSVVSQFIERAKVEAGEDITADSLLHCELSCGGSVLCKGRRGLIVGGRISAGRQVSATNIGSDAYVPTAVFVGLDPKARDRIKLLEGQLVSVQQELDKCDQAERALRLRSGAQEALALMLLQVTNIRQRALENQAALTEEYELLTAQLENSRFGRVNVKGQVYPGATLSLGSGRYVVRSRIDYATFRQSGKEVVFGAYEGV